MEEFDINDGLPTGSHWTITKEVVARWPAALLNGKPVIAVDFDHTITSTCEVCTNEVVLQEGVVEAMQKLHKRYAIIIYTGRDDIETITMILGKYGIPFDDIRKKPNACFYIDDRAIHHRSWKETLEEVKRRGGE